MRVSEIRVKRIRVNQGLGVLEMYNFVGRCTVKAKILHIKCKQQRDKVGQFKNLRGCIII